MTFPSHPHLRRIDSNTQLYVAGQPFLILGGELGNSTASDLGILDDAMRHCHAMHLNTVMLPVYWDRVEPDEGRFDFSLVQGAIDLARTHQLKLVYLWFGTWKNSMSCYAPQWVKRDTQRFFRARQSDGQPLEIISPACTAARDADARAFSELMAWTRACDADRHTVIMAQVENEVGMIPDPRDHCDAAEQACQGRVPDALLTKLINEELGPEIAAIWKEAGQPPNGTWPEVFGNEPEGQEVFTAWMLAGYVEAVAAAGKQAYPLPTFTNAALIRPGHRPNQYPSGAPLPHLMELWSAAAPSIDMFCPDIYFPNFMEWCDRYQRGDNPLFIPEMAPSARVAGNAVYAIAHHHAIGTGPFAIEDLSGEKQELLAGAYEHLADMSCLVLDAQQTRRILGLSPQVGFDWDTDPQPQQGTLSDVTFNAHFDHPLGQGDVDITTLPTFGPGRWEAPPAVPRGALLMIQRGPDAFTLLGLGVTVTFTPANGQGNVGILDAQEGRYEDGQWQGGRWLNGDQTHQGRHIQLHSRAWSVQNVTLYRY